MFYATNALYKALESSVSQVYVWPPRNTWLLAYGDSQGEPKAIIFVKGFLGDTESKNENKRSSQLIDLGRRIAENNGISFGTIEFEKEINEMYFNGIAIESESLRDSFKDFGLDVVGKTRKEINSASSSPYHLWQRQNLGNIKVSDIDLIQVDSNTQEIVSVIELKRSYIALDKWKPFEADFPNFNLLAKLCKNASAKLLIVYNVRHKVPKVFDNISLLTVFEYSISNGTRKIGSLKLEDFLKGNLGQ
jgi:hypothetical protein